MNNSRNPAIDWERTVIATAISSPASMEEAGELQPADFSGANKIVWAEILAAHARGGLDIRSLINCLRDAPDWVRASGGERFEDYLAEVMTFRGTNMRSYAEQVIESSIKRSLRTYAAVIASEAEDDTRTAAELLESAEQKILALRRARNDQELTMADIIGIFLPRMQGMIDGTVRPAWTPETAAVREVISYLEPEDFMVVAARPGEGKSSYMRWEFYNAARNRMPVAILNYENAPIEYARYFIAMITGIDSEKLKNPRRLTRDELARVRAAAEEVARLPISVVTTPRTANAMIQTARRLVTQKQIQLLGVDYLQLINNGIENRVNDIAYTTGVLRGFALDFKVPVMANAQLNRDIERRGADNSEPQLADLRDSGSIEQDATVVAFPRPDRKPSSQVLSLFDENHDEDGMLLLNRPRAVPVIFHVAKNRNGTTGPSDPVKWCKHTGVFQTLQRGAIPTRGQPQGAE